MALATNIVLTDAQATPVNHTFIPLGKDKENVFWWEDQSAPSPIGYNRVSAEIRRPLPAGPQGTSNSSRMYRVKVNLHMPTLETVGTADNGLPPPPTISYIARGGFEILMPERTSLQNRKDLRKMLGLLIAEAQIVSMIESLIPVY